MYDLHLQPGHISGGRSANQLSFSSMDVDINGASSPPLSDYSSIAPSAIQSSRSSGMNYSVGSKRTHHLNVGLRTVLTPERSSSKESTSLSTGSSRARSQLSKESTSLYTGSSYARSQLLQLRHTPPSPASLEQEINDLCQLNSNLEEKYKILEVQHETLRDAYDALLNALLQIGALKDQEDKPTEVARREDYPDVHYWARRDWIDRSSRENDTIVLDSGSRRGKTRASQGINVTMRYVEDRNGTEIDGHRAAEMRRHARLIWVHMAKKDEGGLPPSWGKADVKLSQTYCREMCQRFPELALCELDWKADQIATDNYPSWYKNWSETTSKVSVKQEVTTEISDTAAVLNQKRRSIQLTDEPAAKKPKVNARPSELAGMEANTSGFQIKNPLAIVDTSKMNLLVTSLVSATTPQDSANITVSPTVTSGGTATSDAAVTSTMTPPVTAGFPSEIALATSDTTVTTATTIPVTMATPPGMASSTDATVSLSITTMPSSTVAFPTALTPFAITTNSAASFGTTTMPTTTVETFSMNMMNMPGTAAVPGLPAVSRSTTPFATTTNSAASFGTTTMPTTTVETFSMMNMPGTAAVPAVSRSTPIAANSAVSFAMPMPTSTVDQPSLTTVTTDANAPVIVTSNTSLPNGGIETNNTTKKKLTTKKRTTNSNTPKNLCAREWVLAVGGTTEAFDRHWDGLPEEEKQKYIERSKQLKLAASSR